MPSRSSRIAGKPSRQQQLTRKIEHSSGAPARPAQGVKSVQIRAWLAAVVYGGPRAAIFQNVTLAASARTIDL